MSVGPILTLGIGALTGGGVKYIPTLGFGTGGTPPPPVVTGTPAVGNNTFWKKGYRQIGQTRRWRYWWETDPCAIPETITLSEDIEEIQAESNAVASCITDMVMERAAEATLQIMRAYYEVLQEQIEVRQKNARIEAGIVQERKKKEAAIIRKKKIMLLLN